MKYVMFTYSSPELADRWEAMTAAERQAVVDDHLVWFREHAGNIVAGEELAWPYVAKTLTKRDGAAVVTDGPYVETKELFGGFVVLEADDEADIVSIASAWPGLDFEGGAVSVFKTGSSAEEASEAS